MISEKRDIIGSTCLLCGSQLGKPLCLAHYHTDYESIVHWPCSGK